MTSYQDCLWNLVLIIVAPVTEFTLSVVEREKALEETASLMICWFCWWT